MLAAKGWLPDPATKDDRKLLIAMRLLCSSTDRGQRRARDLDRIRASV